MKTVATLFVVTAMGLFPALAQPVTTSTTTTKTSTGYETTILRSDGSSYSSKSDYVSPGKYSHESTYTPPPALADAMRKLCPPSGKC